MRDGLHGRIAMLQLSLEDCGLADRNVYVKEHEKECLYSLYPDYGKTVQPIAVRLNIVSCDPSMEALI